MCVASGPATTRVISRPAGLVSSKRRVPAPRKHRRDRGLELVEEARGEALLHDRRTARDRDVLPSAGRARLRHGRSRPSVTKVNVVPFSSSGSRA